MLIFYQHTEGFCSKGKFLTNLRIAMLYYCSVKIYCNSHLYS